MRKTFKLFCAAAVALLAVSSCGKIEDSLHELEQGLADLTARVQALEDKLNEQVATINTELGRLDDKIAVVDVKKEGENYVLTFADGNTLTVAAAGSKGFVTTVEVGGVTHWAIIDQNGEPQVLDATVHPDTQLKFSVDPETYEVSVSYDNGKNWVATGVFVKDNTTINVFTALKFEEGAEFLTITVGGTDYRLPVYSEDTSSLVLGRADFFLRYEGSKNVELKAEGIAEYYVMNEPDGWKAVIDGTTLTVTAPTKKAIEIGAAEAEGLILVHGTTADGKCKVAKVEVKAGPGLTLAIDIDGNVTIENSYYGESTNMWGETSFGFSDFIFGLATPELFKKDPEAYVQVYNDTWSTPSWDDIIFPSGYNFAQQGAYVEGEYETDVVKTTVADAYFSMFYDELPAGAHYVVWVAPVTGEGKAVIEDMIYVEYVNMTWKVAVKEVSHNDITLTAEVGGASRYIINAVAESYYNSEWNPMTFEDYMNAPMGGPWSGFKNYGAADALGVVVEVADVLAEFKLSEILGEKLAFGENYKIWVMPVFDHLAVLDEANSYPEEGWYTYDYSAFDFEDHFLPFVLDAKTNDIVAGGEYAATLTLNRKDYTSIHVDVALSEGTDVLYHAWYKAADYDAFETDADVMAALFEDCYTPLTAAKTVSKTYINPGEEWYLATVSIGTDGKYGEVVAEKFSTTAIPYDSAVSATLETLTLDAATGEYTAVFNVTGATKFVAYNAYLESASTFPTNVCKSPGIYLQYKWVDVVDGKATVVVKPSSSTYDYLIYSAYNMDGTSVSGLSEPASIQLSTSVTE